MDSTLDVARRCPTCEELGKAVGTRPCPERYMGVFHIYRCENTRCARQGRDWLIQIRPDGSIPEPTTNREKSFPQEKGVARGRIEAARAKADMSLKDSIG